MYSAKLFEEKNILNIHYFIILITFPLIMVIIFRKLYNNCIKVINSLWVCTCNDVPSHATTAHSNAIITSKKRDRQPPKAPFFPFSLFKIFHKALPPGTRPVHHLVRFLFLSSIVIYTHSYPP